MLVPLKSHDAKYDRILIYGGNNQFKEMFNVSFICEVNPELELNIDVAGCMFFKPAGGLTQYYEDTFDSLSFFKIHSIPSWLS